MGLAFSILFLFFGWLYFIVKWIREARASKKSEEYRNRKCKERDVFTERVANVKEQDICCSNEELNNAYDEAVAYLETVGLSKSFAEELRKDNNCRLLFSKLIFVANKGHLTTATSPGQPIFRIPVNFPVVLEKIRVFYKWFDYKLNSFYPQYFMVRYETHAGNVKFYEYDWNVFVWNHQKNRKRVSEISIDDLIENKIK